MQAVYAVAQHRCSFCGKHQDEVSHLVAGPGTYICDECVALCQRVIAGQPVQGSFALDDRTAEELLEDARRIAASRDQVDEAVRDRVRRARGQGASWARVGESLGITRQSAWERFSDPED